MTTTRPLKRVKSTLTLADRQADIAWIKLQILASESEPGGDHTHAHGLSTAGAQKLKAYVEAGNNQINALIKETFKRRCEDPNVFASNEAFAREVEATNEDISSLRQTLVAGVHVGLSDEDVTAINNYVTEHPDPNITDLKVPEKIREGKVNLADSKKRNCEFASKEE